jgi:hypothetical protein
VLGSSAPTQLLNLIRPTRLLRRVGFFLLSSLLKTDN